MKKNVAVRKKSLGMYVDNIPGVRYIPPEREYEITMTEVYLLIDIVEKYSKAYYEGIKKGSTLVKIRKEFMHEK